MDQLSKLANAHDYFGIAKDLYGHIDKVKKWSDIDPHDVGAMMKLAGLKDKNVKKLLDTLEKRAKAAEATATAKYPPIKGMPPGEWKAWWKAGLKHGLDSKEAHKARSNYQKQLIWYDKKVLRTRTTYCDIIIKHSGKQVKIYKGLFEVWKTTQKILEILINDTPAVIGTAHHSKALAMWHNFLGVGPRATRIAKAHKKIIDVAKAHKAAVMKIKDTNDVWIKDIRAAELSSMISKALKAMGIAA
jgi:hypothetical protein